MHQQGLMPDEAPVCPECGISILGFPDTEYCTWNSYVESGASIAPPNRGRERSSLNVNRDYVRGLPIYRENHVDLAASAQCERQSDVDLVEPNVIGSRSRV